MRYATVRDFKINATKFLTLRDQVVITRRGSPVAVLMPVRPHSSSAVFLKLRQVLKEAGVSKKEVLAALDEVRKEVYAAGRS